jgi:hypothetical protein
MGLMGPRGCVRLLLAAKELKDRKKELKKAAFFEWNNWREMKFRGAEGVPK